MENHQNIIASRDSLLQNINLAAIVENFKPVSLTSNKLKAGLSEAINEAKISTVSSVLHVFEELAKQSNIDSGAMHAKDALCERLDDNALKVKTIYCFEAISTSAMNSFSGNALTKLDNLIAMNEDAAKQHIRNGYITSEAAIFSVLNLLINEAAIKTADGLIAESTEFRTYNPVTFAEVNEGGTIHVRFGNRVFEIADGRVNESVKMPSEKFRYITAVINEMQWTPDCSEFTFESAELGKLTVSNEEITRTVNESVTTFGIDELSKNLMFVEESMQSARSKNSARQQIDGISILAENMASVVKCDNVLVVENLRKGEKFAYFKLANDSHAVAVIESSFSAHVTEHFKHPADAVKYLKTRSGYDASAFVAEELTAVTESAAIASQIANEHVSIINDLRDRRNNVVQQVAEARAERNDKKVEALNETLTYIDSLILEQKNHIASLVK